MAPPQSLCSPLCPERGFHAHVRIPAPLAPVLHALAQKSALHYSLVKARIVRLAARAVRENGPKWIETNGAGGTTVETDMETDHALNRFSHPKRGVGADLAQALIVAKVIHLCERTSLSEALSYLESCSPLPLV